MYVTEGKCVKARNPTVLNVITISIGMSKYGCLLDQISTFKWAGWLATTSLGHTLYSTKTLAINTDNLIFCIYT
jgi:hypothetical protein